MTTSETGAAATAARADSVPQLKDSPRRWILMALLVTSMIFCYAHRGALSVATPYMIEDLGLSKARMGILLSAFFWVYSFLQMPAGWMVDRFGVRRAYAFGYAFWSLASILTGFAKSLPMLIGLRVSLGVGQAVAFPAAARAVANWFQDRERGMATGSYLVGVRLGTALISWVGGWFLARYDWKLFFIVTGAVPLLWLFPWTAFLRGWEDVGAPSSGVAAKKQASFVESLRLLRHRTVFGIFLGFFAYDYAWFVFLTWLPGYLVMERKFTAEEMGVYSAAPYLAMSLIIFGAGVLSDWMVRRFGNEARIRKAFIIAGLLVGCLIVPAGMVEDKMTAVWLLTISLCGLGLASPNTWTLTQALCAKSIVGTISGIQNFGGNLGGIIAPALTGYIAHATGSFALALGITGVALVVGIFAYWLLIDERVEPENINSLEPASSRS
jgi:sugar phosphate permease